MERSVSREPRFLIIETSSRVGQVALAEGDRVCGVRRLDEARRHARDLVPMIVELMAERDWKPKEVDAVIVGLGPGSYTGLRVGIMSAKTFAYATGVKAIGVPTFLAIARQTPAGIASVDVIADAQQGKVYSQSFRRDAGETMRESATLQIVSVSDWGTARDSSVPVTGPGLGIYQKTLSAACLAPDLWDPQPATLSAVGFERFRLGESNDIWAIEPIYLRPSSAEEKKRDRDAATVGGGQADHG
jgi:tRNA threonylcarbamoyladenosine biosynthesis protein TsaB